MQDEDHAMRQAFIRSRKAPRKNIACVRQELLSVLNIRLPTEALACNAECRWTYVACEISGNAVTVSTRKAPLHGVGEVVNDVASRVYGIG